MILRLATANENGRKVSGPIVAAATQGRPYGCVPVRTSEAGMEFRL